MKNYKRILLTFIVAVLFMLITTVCSNAEESGGTIDKGVYDEETSTVTFTITFPTQTVLRGDVNFDGVVDQNDVDSYVDIVTGNMSSDELLSADIDGDGAATAKEIKDLREYIENLPKITTTGSLNAEKIEITKGSGINSIFSIKVTVEKGKDGTIGVIIPSEIFRIHNENKFNDEMTSEMALVSITKLEVVSVAQYETADKKIAVKIEYNKEIDPNSLTNGWSLLDDGYTITKNMEPGVTETVTVKSINGDDCSYEITAMQLRVDENSNDNDDVEKENNNEGIKQSSSTTTLPQTGSNTFYIAITFVTIFLVIGIVCSIKYFKFNV